MWKQQIQFEISMKKNHNCGVNFYRAACLFIMQGSLNKWHFLCYVPNYGSKGWWWSHTPDKGPRTTEYSPNGWKTMSYLNWTFKVRSNYDQKKKKLEVIRRGSLTKKKKRRRRGSRSFISFMALFYFLSAMLSWRILSSKEVFSTILWVFPILICWFAHRGIAYRGVNDICIYL